jgi:V8-like Glu-specific endopeptidase
VPTRKRAGKKSEAKKSAIKKRLAADRPESEDVGTATQTESPPRGGGQNHPAALTQAGDGLASSAQEIRLPEPPEGGWRDIGLETYGPPREREDSLRNASSPAERRPAPDLRLQPWSRICDLLITARDGSKHSGTAWFISHRTLVTAGHCLFVHNRGRAIHGFVKEIVVMPARRGEMFESHSLFGWALAPEGSFQVHPEWERRGDRDFDYGVIVLPQATPLGARTGFFRYGNFENLNGAMPFLSGYPDDEPRGTIPEGTQWFERNPIMSVTPRRVDYDIFTVLGMSGSPVFLDVPERQDTVACAIHNFGDQHLNTGVRINQEVSNQLDAWLVP